METQGKGCGCAAALLMATLLTALCWLSSCDSEPTLSYQATTTIDYSVTYTSGEVDSSSTPPISYSANDRYDTARAFLYLDSKNACLRASTGPFSFSTTLECGVRKFSELHRYTTVKITEND
jgi:hypothetical protein